MHRQAVIGLIGGLSWESSAQYYRIINREVRERLGGVHSARSLMWSVDFGEIEHLQHIGDWDQLTEQMKDAAVRLEHGGADFVLICSNTMHRMADAVARAAGESVAGETELADRPRPRLFAEHDGGGRIAGRGGLCARS